MSAWKPLCSNLTPYGDNRVVFNTYERDWYASPKELGETTFFNLPIYLSGKMYNSDNWYTYDPINPLTAINLQYIYNNWLGVYAFDIDPNGVSKGQLRIWRVDN